MRYWLWSYWEVTITGSFVSFSFNTSFSVDHYDDVIMSAIASQITSLTIVYSTVYSGADQNKYQSSASLAFVWGIHPPGTGEFPAQMASNAENVSIWWRHHVKIYFTGKRLHNVSWKRKPYEYIHMIFINVTWKTSVNTMYRIENLANWRSFYQHELTLIPICTSNYNHYKVSFVWYKHFC